MTLIELTYTGSASAAQSAAALTQALDAPVVAEGELELLGMSVDSDVSLIFDGRPRRIITLLVGANGELNFPTDDEKRYATRNLYKQALATKALLRMSAEEPAVIPSVGQTVDLDSMQGQLLTGTLVDSWQSNGFVGPLVWSAAGAARPTRVPNAGPDLGDVVAFDGANTIMTNALITVGTVISAAAFTGYYVVRTTAAALGVLLGEPTAAPATLRIPSAAGGPVFQVFMNDGAPKNVITAVGANVWVVLGFRLDPTSGTLTIQVLGGAPVSVASGAVATPLANVLNLGARSAGNEHFVGQLRRALVYNVAHDDATFAATLQTLGTLYGLP